MPKIVKPPVKPAVKPAADTTPDTLRPYIFHGIDLDWGAADKEALADCPFCNGSRKFSVNIENGVYKCWNIACPINNEKGGGNARIFVRRLWTLSDDSTKDYADLAKERRLLYPETLAAWGVAKSIINGTWLVPGYGADKSLNQVYRYLRIEGRWRLIPTPTLKQHLHGSNGIYDKSKRTVYICEGPWDAMALWEVLGKCKRNEDGHLSVTSSSDANLLADGNVLAVPGCSIFSESWLPLCAGKDVCLLYDSDHPKRNGKTVVPPAGWAGMERVVKMLSASDKPPASIRVIQWGEGGYDPTLPSGYDVRDCLSSLDPSPNALGMRLEALDGLLRRLGDPPKAWIVGQGNSKNSKGGHTPGEGELELLECTDYKTLIDAWRKAMKWTDGLDHALAVMLASVTSTKSVGDQLWIKVIGPASSGKSTLCEALSANHEFVLAKSTIRGFHSGYSDDGGEDHSLISKIGGKTLVTKDGDTLLQSPNLGQILSEARDVYDTVSRTSYRNKSSRDYAGVRMTWILCGTSSLRALDSSELGERFLDCVIMEGIDDDLEDEILWRVAHRADRNLNIEADGQASTHQEPEMTAVMQLTGGYVGHLRRNATDLLSQAMMTDEAKQYCTRLGKFVAFMRARPSEQQDETAEREFAARLVSQLVRLAKCLAVVVNAKSVTHDGDVMLRVKRVALDTSRGQTLEMVKHLFTAGQGGIENRGLALFTSHTEDQTRKMLRFLKLIGVVETFAIKCKGISATKSKWRLTEKMRKLYAEVYRE